MRRVMIAVTLTGCATLSAAQDAPTDTVPVEAPAPPAAEPTAPEKAEGNPLQQIIVTAQRREERLQDVPISITVLDQQQLSNANITNASDLATYTPSLSANRRFGNENAAFAIRGFTQDLRTTSSVATYFAEVVAPRGQSNQTSGDGAGPGAFFDLQNVQVLKGPQGTLFGRNTTGGAVLILPNKPADEFEGYVEITGGDVGQRQAQGVINVPVNERFRVRFGIDDKRRDGHLDNVARIGTDELGDVDYTAYRLSAVWDVTDSIENYTILSYTDSKNHGYTSKLFDCNPAAPLGVLIGVPCQQQLANEAASGNDGWYDVQSTVATPISQIKEKRLINTTAWNVSEGLTVKNILAYGDLWTMNGSSIFGTNFKETAAVLTGLDVPIGLVDSRREFADGFSIVNPNFPVTNQNTLVEEVQLQGNSGDDRFDWQAGAYYERSKPDGFSGNNSASLLYCELATLEKQASEFNCLDPAAGIIGSVRELAYKQDYLNRAVYTQMTYDVLERLSVTAGIRYTWDRTKGHGERTVHKFALNVPQPPVLVITDPRVESKAPTGLVELSYRPIDDVMTYAKYIRGYRQGSVNMSSDPGVDTYEPEKVDTYEIGAKTSFYGWIPGRLNFAAFYNDFTDMQLQTGYVSPNAGPTTAIFNAGKARIAGVEVEGFFQLTRDLSASLSYAHLDTKLLKQEDHTADLLAAGGPLAALTSTPIADVGDELPFAADHSGVVGLTYRLPLAESVGTIDLGLTWVYTGKQRTAATSSTPYDELDDFQLLNANLTWIGIFGTPVDLVAFGTNLLDEKYVTYISGTYNALGLESRMIGLPRMIGARLKYRFGAYAHR